MRQHQCWVYIAASSSRTIHTGVTINLERRMWEHKGKLLKGFTARHGVTRLVYVEGYRMVDDPIAREKQLESWRRERKLALIAGVNPNWHDLSHDWSS